jgi:hypothetical protein
MQIQFRADRAISTMLSSGIQIAFIGFSTDRRFHGSTTPDASEAQATQGLSAAQKGVSSFDAPRTGQIAGKEGTGSGRMIQ